MRPGIEPKSPGPLTNTLLIRPMSRFLSIDYYFFFFFHSIPIFTTYTFFNRIFTSILATTSEVRNRLGKFFSFGF